MDRRFGAPKDQQPHWTGAAYPLHGDNRHVQRPVRKHDVDVDGLQDIQYVTFDTRVSPPTPSDRCGNSQTHAMANNGTYQIGANAATGQTFNCAIQLGTVTNGASFTFRNDSPLQTLTLNDLFVPSPGRSTRAPSHRRRGRDGAFSATFRKAPRRSSP
jgi:hypothetical protein